MIDEYERMRILAGEAVGLIDLPRLAYSVRPDPNWRGWLVTVYQAPRRQFSDGIDADGNIAPTFEPPPAIAEVLFTQRDQAGELAQRILAVIDDGGDHGNR